MATAYIVQFGHKKALQNIVSIIRRSSVMIDHRVSHCKYADKYCICKILQIYFLLLLNISNQI